MGSFLIEWLSDVVLHVGYRGSSDGASRCPKADKLIGTYSSLKRRSNDRVSHVTWNETFQIAIFERN